MNATLGNIPKELNGEQVTHAYVKLLNENLKILTDLSTKFQKELIEKRTNIEQTPQQSIYQPGDFVLFQLDYIHGLPNKLTPKFEGSFEVIHQEKNDVTVRNLNQGDVRVMHVERLKFFHGDREQAIAMARLDNDQHLVDSLITYHGDPKVRTTM
jgi:hypothetical protein